MSEENKSQFLESQMDVCEVRPIKVKEEEEPKICPTCRPDPSAAVPDWWSIDRPFLNKRTCEYSIAVTINENAETYSVAELGSELYVQKDAAEYRSGLTFEDIKRSYVKPGIKMMLAYYNKLITDEIVCANPPETAGDKCGPGFNPATQVLSVEPPTSADFDVTPLIRYTPGPASVEDTARNLDALEVYAKTPEFRFTTANDSGILQVLVTLPAHIFDKSPDAPPIEEPDTDVKRLKMKGKDMRMAFIETISALNVFASYQSFFYQTENGNLMFKNSVPSKTFYLSNVVTRMENFFKALKTLLETNDFRFEGDFGFEATAEEVIIVFDKGDDENPYKIKKVKAKRKGCAFENLKSGINDLRKYAEDPTTMGYIARLDKIHPQLTARQTPPWLDFVIENTFPKLIIDFGSAGKFDDEKPDSCLGDINAINRVLLGSVLTFSKYNISPL